MMLGDAHCHIDFAGNAEELAADLAVRGVFALSSTVSVRDYACAKEMLATYPQVKVGLGMHPWWLADGSLTEEDIALFERYAKSERFIGEIGLDFGKKCVADERARALQVSAFSRAVAACSPGSVLSLHASHAEDAALDVLERAGALKTCTCIFHWYAGSSNALCRAREAGCLFSINPRMLASKRGREYVRAIPLERMLLETDSPSGKVARFSAQTQADELVLVLEGIAELKSLERAEVAARVGDTFWQVWERV